MSFIYRDRNDDDYVIGFPWMKKDDWKPSESCQCVSSSEYPNWIKLEEDQKRFENFYAGML